MKQDYLVPLSLIILLLVLCGIGWGVNWFLAQGADSVTAIAEQLEADIFRQDWNKAQATFTGLKKTWLEMSRYWPMLIHHQEMDRIEESLAKLEIYLQYQKASEAQAELKTLSQYIRHIPQKEALNLKNLF